MAVSNFVKSVEYISDSFVTSDTLLSVNLTKGQDYNNCVPFFTVYGPSDYYSSSFLDAYFSGTTESGILNFERGLANGVTNNVKCYVVEFDPSEIAVQQGTFDLSTSTTDTVTLSGTLSDTNKAFMHFGWKTFTNSRHGQYNLVRGSVTSTTTVDFYVYATGGIVSGHWFLVEDLGNNFEVTHITDTQTGTELNIPLGNNKCVDIVRSFILTSYASSDASGYPSRIGMRAILATLGTIKTYRNDGSYNGYVNHQYVEFMDKSKIYTPFDYTLITVGTTQLVREVGGVTENPFLCNPDTTSVINLTPQGICRVDDSNAAYVNEMFTSVHLSASGTLTYDKSGSAKASYLSHTVAVDWAGISLISGTNNNIIPEGDGPGQSFVKSVENIEMQVSENYSLYQLSKGQAWENCVLFPSYYTTGDDYYPTHTYDVHLLEPGIVVARRLRNSGTGYLSISAVEFWPEQVKVQHGSYDMDISATNAIIPIEPVNSINKSFILSKTVNTTTDRQGQYSFLRVGFSTTSGIDLYRYAASTYTNVSYFVVEDLKDNFDVRHHLETMTSNSFTVLDDSLDFNSSASFNLLTYATNEALGYPSRLFLTSAVEDEVAPAYIFKGDGTYSMYLYSSIVRFKSDKYRVEYILKTLTSPYTDTYTDRFSGHEHALSCIVPGQFVGMEVYDSNAAYINEAWYATKITDYDNRTYSITKYGSTKSNRSVSFIIDWIGEHYQDKNNISQNTPTKSVVQSVEKFDFENSDWVMEADLTLGQDIEKCVPFVTNNLNDSTNWHKALKTVHRYSDPDMFRLRYADSDAGNRKTSLYVIEFSDEVNVQIGNVYIESTYIDVDITPVNLEYTFLHFFHADNSTTEYAQHHHVCGHFTSASGIRFERDAQNGAVFIAWYVVEAPNEDFWTVDHAYYSTPQSGSTLTYSDNRDYEVSKSMHLVSYTCNNTTTYPSRNFFRSRPIANKALVLDRQDGSYSIMSLNHEIVKFSDKAFSEGFKCINLSFSLAGTSSAEETLSSTAGCIVPYRSFAITSNALGTGRSDNSTVSYSREAFHYYEIIDDNTVRATKIGTGAATYSTAYVYQMPEPNAYYMEGYVKEQGTPVQREVRAYRAETGEIVDKTTSRASDGYFLLESRFSDAHYVVCLDDEAGTNYNDLVYGKMYPTAISGCWLFNKGLTTSGIDYGVPLGRL